MINLPSEVKKVMKTLTDNGYKAYAVGGCVRDALIGRKTNDFDLVTDAKFNQLGKLFKNAVVLSEELSVVRFEQKSADGKIRIELATLRKEGEYSDFRHPDEVAFVETFEEDCCRRDFTVNAIGYDADKDELLDFCGGTEDIENRVIRTIGNPEERFAENPIRMMRAVRFAAQSGFGIDKDTFDAIKKKAYLIQNAGQIAAAEELKKIMLADNAGEGIKFLIVSGLAYYITGGELDYEDSQMIEKMMAYAGCIDGFPLEYEVRIGAFYSCFDEDSAERAVRALNLSHRLEKKLLDAIYMQETLTFVENKYELKGILATSGYEQYEYAHQLSGVMQRVYSACGDAQLKEKGALYKIQIERRDEMLSEIIENNEPIYFEELAVNGRDLAHIGINAGVNTGRILMELADVVHHNPEKNTKSTLLAVARKLNSSLDEE